MKQFVSRPIIYKYNTFKEFADDFNIGKDDFILTTKPVYEASIKKLNLNCQIKFYEDYGSGEPSDEKVEKIYNDINMTQKRIIGIGGGSVLDVAKLLSLKEIIPVVDVFKENIKPVRDKELILIPTTCGTGSEVTHVSILELISLKTKKRFASEEIFADSAVLIPNLLENLPYVVFATSSIDALIHGVESALSPTANIMTRMFSYKAIEIILKGYIKMREKGKEVQKEVTEEFLFASTIAGIAFLNAGCAAVHALSYPLGAKYHIVHGEANYAIFMGVMREYMKRKTDGEIDVLISKISDILCCDKKDAFDELERLLECILPRKSLCEYGVKREELRDFAKSVLKNQGIIIANSFVELDEDDVVGIYEALY